MHTYRLKHAQFRGTPPHWLHPQTGLPNAHEHAIQNHNTPNTSENDWQETKDQMLPDVKDFLRERVKGSVSATWSGVLDPPSGSRNRGPGAQRRGCPSKLGSPKGWQPRSRGGAWPRGRGPRGQSWPRRCHPRASGRGGGQRGQGAVSGVRAGQDPLPPPHAQSPGPITFW